MTTALHSLDVVEVTHNIGSIAANTSEEESVTVPGVAVGDFVICSKSDLDAGVLIGSCRVSAANTVQVQFVNATAGAVDPASETLSFLVFRPYARRSAFNP